MSFFLPQLYKLCHFKLDHHMKVRIVNKTSLFKLTHIVIFFMCLFIFKNDNFYCCCILSRLSESREKKEETFAYFGKNPDIVGCKNKLMWRKLFLNYYAVNYYRRQLNYMCISKIALSKWCGFYIYAFEWKAILLATAFLLNKQVLYFGMTETIRSIWSSSSPKMISQRIIVDTNHSNNWQPHLIHRASKNDVQFVCYTFILAATQ